MGQVGGGGVRCRGGLSCFVSLDLHSCYMGFLVAHEIVGIDVELLCSTSKTPGPEKGGPAYHDM